MKMIWKTNVRIICRMKMMKQKRCNKDIYSDNWENIPVTVAEQLKKYSSNNIYEGYYKNFMITSSGAEGISLKNGRIALRMLEPYWHPVKSRTSYR